MRAYVKSHYHWIRIWWAYQRVRLNRLWLTIFYGRKAVAKAVSDADQKLQANQDAFRAKLKDLDEKYEKAVREGRAKPLPKRLSDHDWFP